MVRLGAKRARADRAEFQNIDSLLLDVKLWMRSEFQNIDSQLLDVKLWAWGDRAEFQNMASRCKLRVGAKAGGGVERSKNSYVYVTFVDKRPGSRSGFKSRGVAYTILSDEQ